MKAQKYKRKVEWKCNFQNLQTFRETIYRITEVESLSRKKVWEEFLIRRRLGFAARGAARGASGPRRRQCVARGRAEGAGATAPTSVLAAMPPRALSPPAPAPVIALWTRADLIAKLNKFDKSSSFLDHYIDEVQRSSGTW